MTILVENFCNANFHSNLLSVKRIYAKNDFFKMILCALKIQRFYSQFKGLNEMSEKSCIVVCNLHKKN